MVLPLNSWSIYVHLNGDHVHLYAKLPGSLTKDVYSKHNIQVLIYVKLIWILNQSTRAVACLHVSHLGGSLNDMGR